MKLENKTQAQLKKQCRSLFRQKVRLMDTNKTGKGKCFTCGKNLKLGTRNCQAGHFDHNHESTYYNILNCKLQCASCNNWGLGMGYVYGNKINELYGDGTADMLIKRGHETIQISKEEYQKRINTLRKEIKKEEDKRK